MVDFEDQKEEGELIIKFGTDPYKDCNHESPEIKLHAITKWVSLCICRFG
jgi:hypothetical protein